MSENNMGWICPRCGAVNSPSARRCDCKPREKSTQDVAKERNVWPQPPKESCGTPIWVHKCDNPFENMPRFDFMVRPWLVKYAL